MGGGYPWGSIFIFFSGHMGRNFSHFRVKICIFKVKNDVSKAIQSVSMFQKLKKWLSVHILYIFCVAIKAYTVGNTLISTPPRGGGLSTGGGLSMGHIFDFARGGYL